MNTKTSELFLYLLKFLKQQKTSFFFIGLSSLVWSLNLVVWPLILRAIIDLFNRYDLIRSEALTALTPIIIFSLLFWLLVEVGFRAQGFLLAKALPKLESKVRLDMFDHVQRHSPQYFNKHMAGSLVNKISDMTNQIGLILQPILITFIPSIIGCALGILSLYFISPLFALLTLIWIIIHFSICFIFMKPCDKLEQANGNERSMVIGKISDSLSNNFIVNLFYQFAYEKKRLQNYQEKEQEINKQSKMKLEWMRTWLGLFTFLFAGVLINGYMLYAWLDNSITTGEATQIFNMTWNICIIIWTSVLSIPAFFHSIGLAKQAFSIMLHPSDIDDKSNAKPLEVTKGEIVFENVTFQHSQDPLFQNKNVHIKPGEKIGLVGFSGAGKSTFINLILRFFELQRGKILIDNQDISEVTLESLRSQIALIPQDPQLFNRSFIENLNYGAIDKPIEAIHEAAKKSFADHFIEKCPSGYLTDVGEKGSKLSGGEKQRCAIARAILADKPILILDEATSALDSVTEDYIQKSFSTLMEKRTTIVIAHRLSTLSKMDRILVFDKGKIIEEGSHIQLIEKGGLYKRMWEMQSGGFINESII
jgi:ATP-binding cassette subfamily B protein